jgi:hypothetical protein
MKSRKSIAALAVILLLPVMASAEWERTVGAWDTRLPDKGEFQTSFWGNYSKAEVGNADLTGKDAYFDVVYGISDEWSVYVSPSFSAWSLDGGASESGLSDTMLQTTYRFRDEAADNFGLAVMGRLLVPTGNEDKGLGGGTFEPGAKALASKTCGPVIAVANLGLTAVLNADKGMKDYVLASELEGVYPLNDRLNLNAALFAATARNDGGDLDTDLGVGSRYNVKDQMFVGAVLYKCMTETASWGLQLAAGVQF